MANHESHSLSPAYSHSSAYSTSSVPTCPTDNPLILAFDFAGIIWPVQSMPGFIRYMAYGLPQTIATESLRCIMYRGWGIERYEVWLGFVVSIFWSCFFLLFATTAERGNDHPSSKVNFLLNKTRRTSQVRSHTWKDFFLRFACSDDFPSAERTFLLAVGCVNCESTGRSEAVAYFIIRN